jgi:surface antigen
MTARRLFVRQAILNLRLLLIKWAVVSILSTVLLFSFVINPDKVNTQQETAVKNKLAAEKLNSEKSQSKPHSQASKMPVMLPPFKSESDIIKAASLNKQKRYMFSANSAGNTYYRGYCTWYAKSKRPDIPNSLGNANTWYIRAKALGLPTGTEPKAGAIGQQGMHVVYIEKVNKDGTVTISEMNYKGYGIVSFRTVPASYFRYIY